MEQKNLNQPAQEPVTRTFIKKFYEDVTRNRFKRPGGEEEKRRIQARINGAIQSGRVVDG